MSTISFAGVYAPLPTPFDERDRLDVDRLCAALPRWLASPLAGFVLLGTTGEAGLVDDEEADRLVEAVRPLVPRERALLVGVGRESTAATIRAARRAATGGADALLVRTPSFFKTRMNDEALVAYYTAVADSAPAPVLLYNFAAATGVNLTPSAVARLASHPNILGIKESGSDLAQIADLVALASPSFTVLAGSATTFVAALGAGVSGGILALSALLPEACVRLFTLMRAGAFDEARQLQQRLVPLARFISTEHGVPALKAALARSGVDVGLPRRPLVPFDERHLPALHDLLRGFLTEGVPV
ncbi:MAG: dihydrodipicolinate synthase family protein [Acidobacteriaceae bacterium]|nr:dihydrodipicolinate synthase family protein [Acidobacteriaceae bacterium]